MNTELNLLAFLLTIAFVLGPLMVRKFFLSQSKIYSLFHIVALLSVGVGFYLSRPELYGVWIIFCVFGFAIFIKKNLRNFLTLKNLAECIPFVFSIIASVWFYSGANGLQLLDYNTEWSYYAALHGNYLGWMLVGGITLISRSQGDCLKALYLFCAFVYLFLFLLIAFGIDGIPYIKRIGVVGIVLMTPLLIGWYALSLWKYRGASFYLSVLSFLGVIFTLYLATQKELGLLMSTHLFDAPTMVVLHGLVNGAIVIPSLYFALVFDERIQ